MSLEGVTASPLSWPTGYPRAKRRERARFDVNCSTYKAVRAIYRELERMGVSDSQAIISTNLDLRMDGLPRSGSQAAAREDPGAALYFRLKRSDADHHVLACDRWDRVEHNLWAIAKHLDAMRGIERWGVGSREQLFRGFKALPSGERHWREVLSLAGVVTAEDVKARYRDMAKLVHPDAGGTHDRMAELNRARDEALKEVKP